MPGFLELSFIEFDNAEDVCKLYNTKNIDGSFQNITIEQVCFDSNKNKYVVFFWRNQS